MLEWILLELAGIYVNSHVQHQIGLVFDNRSANDAFQLVVVQNHVRLELFLCIVHLTT